MKMKTYNVIIIGSGPAGLFAAMWLERLGIDKVAIIDRHAYPAGGLLNDGKLNFDCRIGLDLNELQIDEDKAQQLISGTKKIFLETEVSSSENLEGSGFRLICSRNKKQISHNAGFILAAPGRSGAYWF